jgi:hypothetical protein
MRQLAIWATTAASMSGLACAQGGGPQPAPYCADLQRVVSIAMTDARFTAIAGKPREGNFSETSISLTGWHDCSLYSSTAYVCDSAAQLSTQAAEETQAALLREIQSCLGEGWVEAKDRSSVSYVVLHSRLRPVSITLSTDLTDRNEHVVRLNMFVRRN